MNELLKNFGKIKCAFNATLAEGVVTKNDTKKLAFKKYVSAISESEILRTQFLVYTNIENKIESDVAKASQFIKENIELFSKFKKKDIYEANVKLAETILFDAVTDELNELHENIARLIFTKRTPDTIDIIVESTASIVNYIISNKTKIISERLDLPNSMLSAVMVEKYNTKYSQLSDSEKQVLKVLIDSTDDQKKEVLSKTIRECLDLIDVRLDTANLDEKDKLLRVKDKLLRDKFEVNEDFMKNISKLVELSGNLK